MAVIDVARRMKHPVPAVMPRPTLSGRIMVNGLISESDVSERVPLKAARFRAKLIVQPKAVAIEHMEMSSRGTRTEPGISSRRSTVERMARRLVRTAKDP